MRPGTDSRTSFRVKQRHDAGRLDQPISHRLVVTLPLAPHPQQDRVSGIDEVDEAHIGLARMLTRQASRILLKGTLSGNRHGQSSINLRRMIEAFTHHFPQANNSRGSSAMRSIYPCARFARHYASSSSAGCPPAGSPAVRASATIVPALISVALPPAPRLLQRVL